MRLNFLINLSFIHSFIYSLISLLIPSFILSSQDVPVANPNCERISNQFARGPWWRVRWGPDFHPPSQVHINTKFFSFLEPFWNLFGTSSHLLPLPSLIAFWQVCMFAIVRNTIHSGTYIRVPNFWTVSIFFNYHLSPTHRIHSGWSFRYHGCGRP